MVVLGILMGLAKYVLPVFVATVLAVVIRIYRRGRARTVGFVGAVLLAAGFALSSLMIVVSASLAQADPGSVGALLDDSQAFWFAGSALPGLLRAAGFILVVFALVAPRPSDRRGAERLPS